MASLQDQLLKAGMVDQKKAKQIQQEKRKAAKQTPKGKAPIDEIKAQAIQTLTEKSARDRDLNRQHQVAAEQKAIAAQIKQLITLNRINRNSGDIAFQFTDGKKIKKMYVTTLLQTQLSKGLVAIVKLGENYELVPAAVATKISQRDSHCVILQNSASKELIAEDDPYADYQIPDDLMW